MQSEEDKCCLDTAPFFQCCCQCKYRLTDYSHPLTNGESVLTPRGYICYVKDLSGPPHPMSGWTEHGVGCELYTEKGFPSVKTIEKKKW